MDQQEILTSHFALVNGVRLHYQAAGPLTGKTVLLLHGFPEFWYGWRRQIAALAEAGFRVIVPDQRGYNLSQKPRGVKQYDLDLLAGDMLALMDQLGAPTFLLAGHDWGAAVAWWLAIHHPQRVEKLAILNVPHPAVMAQNILHNPAQRRKSWYMFFFQIPLLPELLLSLGNHGGAVRLLRSSSLPGAFAEADLAEYRRAWGQPRAWTGMIHWYRALFRRMRRRIPPQAIELPVLILWGEQDVALSVEMAAQSLGLCPQGVLERIPEATHWVQHDAPERVNRALLDFFRGKRILE